MLKQIAAALLAASVAVGPALAVDAGSSKPAGDTAKPAQTNLNPAAQTKVKPAKHVRYHVRHHRHVTHARTKHVKQAKHLNTKKANKLSNVKARTGWGRLPRRLRANEARLITRWRAPARDGSHVWRRAARAGFVSPRQRPAA